MGTLAGEDSAESGDNSLSMTPDVGPSLTPPTRQTTLVPPVRPFPQAEAEVRELA